MEYIIIWGSIVSSFAVWDVLIPEEQKVRFSIYIFNLNFSSTNEEFDNLINGFLKFFSPNGSISFFRVIFYSFIATQFIIFTIILYVSITVFNTDDYGRPRPIINSLYGGYFVYIKQLLSGFSGDESEYLSVIAFLKFILFTLMSAFVDLWTIFLTSNIYKHYNNKKIPIIFVVLMIFFLTLSPIFILLNYLNIGIGYVMFSIIGGDSISIWMINSMLIGFLSALLLFFVQLLSLCIAIFMRILFKLTDIATQPGSKLISFPFTFIGSLIATFSILYRIIST